MPDPESLSRQIECQLACLRAGDDRARARLIELGERRLRALCAVMLHRLPRVQRWEQTGDVFGDAAARLFRSLDQVQPESSRHFFRLAAVQIRRVLIDMARHYGGAEGLGAHHNTGSPSQFDSSHPRSLADREPESLEEWTEFHALVAALPDEQREVFDVLWYHGLSQIEAAAVLGISQRTMKRRWQDAKLAIRRARSAGEQLLREQSGA